jgi:agmatine deiminase
MPAEWARHEATWLSWPHDPVTFAGGRLPAVERTFAAMAAALAEGERVELLVASGREETRAKAALREAGAREWKPGGRARGVRLRRVRTVDVWIRDYGPTFVRRVRGRGPRIAYVRWRFDAWGRKYRTLLRDDGIPDRLGLRMPRFAPGIVLEGGSIDVDGMGTDLTTEQCLLRGKRNPGLSRDDLEARLRAFLGVRRVLWLGEGIVGDDTDGHVDDIARFVAPGSVVCAYEDDPRDENHAPLRDAWRRLRRATDARGRPLAVARLPMPEALHAGRRRLPASYANFYVGNRVVLLPVYGSRARDARAIRVLRKAFPTRGVVPLDARALVYGYGSVHCVTQQQPA